MPRVLSLFSGIGGLDIGFNKAEFNIAACVEIEEVFCKTLRRNSNHFSTTTIHQIDINDFVQKPELWPENIDFIIGGPPCQPFSAGGRRVGGAPGSLDEVRGTLFEPYAYLVDELQPKGFLFENVKGILNSNGGDDWRRINSAFASLGYTLSSQVIDAAEYGVPQHRERVILIGIKGSNMSFKWPSPTHGPFGKQEYITAFDAISDLEFHDDGTEINGKYTELIPEIPEGDNYSFFTLNRNYPKPIFGWRSRFSGFLYKASSDLPVKTLLANPGGWGGPFHWDNRRMTISELKRLQSIPDDWVICGSRSQKIKQIGNSVPPRLANVLAKAVLVQLFDGKNDDMVLVSSPVSDKNSRKARLAKITRAKTIKPQEVKTRISRVRRLIPSSVQTSSQELTYSIAHALGGSLENQSPDFNYDFTKADLNVKVRYNGGNHCAKISIWSDKVYDSKEQFFIHRIFLATPLLIGTLEIYQLEIKTHKDVKLSVIRSWHIFHDLVSEFTSFPSTLHFYGHFTEPHPQFEYEFENLEIVEQWHATLQILIDKHWKLNQNIKLSELQLISNLELENILTLLIFNGVDIRTHKINQQIPEDHFRICYPFPRPIHDRTVIPNTPSIRSKRN